MRPIEKLNIGDVLPNGNTVKEEYRPHGTVYIDLESNIEGYCSYCEVFSSDLEIEHVVPQSQDESLEYHWDNFLLSCGRCNGADNKGSKEVDFSNIYFPHYNNTFLAFTYREGGLITVNENLENWRQTKASNTLGFLGLDKYPGNPKYSSILSRDTRWRNRLEAWNLATDILNDYTNNRISVDNIIRFIKQRGFWSIWFTIFENEPEVKRALIENFAGTATNCFDDNFNPIPRNSNDL